MNNPWLNTVIPNQNIYNGRILAVQKQDSEITMNLYLIKRNSTSVEYGQCIAHLRIKYEDINTTVGPKGEGLEGKDEATLSELYKLLVTRNFDYETFAPENDSDNATINYKVLSGHPLAWDECSYSFTTISGPTWSAYSFFTTPGSSLNGLY